MIEELRKDRGFTQKELAQRIGIAPSQLSRIEVGKTATISSDILILLAKELNVSANYLLGLTPYQRPLTVDIEQLGLSEQAVTRFLKKQVEPDMLNRLL